MLTKDSVLRILVHFGTECLYELQVGEGNVRVTSMSLNVNLGVLALGMSNGRIGVLGWPLGPSK